MLFQLGTVTIDTPGPFNATGTDEEFGADFATKPVIGAEPPSEFTGKQNGRFTITGTLYPYFFAEHGQGTGLEEIEALRAMAESGQPQILVRGDGKNMKWWLIKRVRKRDQHLSQEGIGQEITYEISLESSPRAAAAGGMLATFVALVRSLGG